MIQNRFGDLETLGLPLALPGFNQLPYLLVSCDVTLGRCSQAVTTYTLALLRPAGFWRLRSLGQEGGAPLLAGGSSLQVPGVGFTVDLLWSEGGMPGCCERHQSLTRASACKLWGPVLGLQNHF